MSDSTAKRIGGDWVENTDGGSGRTYYANLVTKVRGKEDRRGGRGWREEGERGGGGRGQGERS